MSKLQRFAKKELREIIPPTVFFLISFHILVLFRALMLKGYGVQVSAVAGATVAALVVGKVVIIADAIPIMNRFPRRPLIYNVLWKTLIYVVAALVVHYLEHLVPAWWRTGSLGDAHRELMSKIVWPHFWAIQLWLVLLFFIYCTLRELIRVLGRDQVREIFLGPPRQPKP